MTQLHKITDDFYVSGQIAPGDFAALAEHGFKSIINNRPDNEEMGQLSAESASAIASENGLAYHHVPMTMPMLSPDLVASFADAIRNSEGPVLAHCRSGQRSCLLWALSQAKEKGMAEIDAILQQCTQAGYDFSGARALIESYAA